MRLIRRILTLILILCILLAGCSRTPKPIESPLARHNGNYSATANIAYRELEARAVISRETPGNCSVTFSAPASLQDLSFIFWGDRVDLGYKGLSFTFDPHSVPGGAVAKMAVGAINAAMKNDGVTVAYEDDALTLSGAMENGGFTFHLDPRDGHLLKLSIPEEELEIEFVDFTFLD